MRASRPHLTPALACLMWTALLVGNSSIATAQWGTSEEHVSVVPHGVPPGGTVSPEFDKVILDLRLGHILRARAFRGDQRVSGVRNVGDKVILDVNLRCTDSPDTDSTRYSEMGPYTIALATPGALPDSGAYEVMRGASEGLLDGAYAIASSSRIRKSPHTVSLTFFTAEDAERLCGSASAGTERLSMDVAMHCARSEESRQGGAGGIIETTASFDVIVACDPNYRVPSTTPVRWRHACPDGWVVNGTDHQVAENGTNTASCVKAGTPAGPRACPYYYLFDPVLQTYVKQGEIMQNLVGRASEALQEETIPARFITDGRLRVSIREEKHEVSFINYLALQVGDRLIPPEPTAGVTASLARWDEDYLRMSTGDEVTLVFDVGPVGPTEPMRLLSAGYYEPTPP